MTPRVHRRLSAALALVSVAAIATARAAAQTASAAPAPLDTTIRPGHLDYSRYTTPGMCLAAARGALFRAERANVDTGEHVLARDTLPTVAVETARSCGRRFMSAVVAPDELVNLARLALMAGDDARAEAAAGRWVASYPAPDQRAWARFELVANTYLAARPARLAATERELARLDSAGAPGVLPFLLAHLATFNAYTQSGFDVPALEREARAAFAAEQRLSPDERAQFTANENYLYNAYPSVSGLGNVFFYMAGVEAYRHPGDWAARAATYGTRSANYKDWLTALQKIVIGPSPTPPASIPATYWVGARPNRSWPVPGKVSMFVYVVGWPDGGTTFYPAYGMIRRLARAYGDALNVTLVTKTRGYLHNSGPLAPTQEAEALREYFVDSLKLPVTVAVDETPFRTMSDGRRVAMPTRFEQIPEYQFPFMSGAVMSFGLAGVQGGRILVLPNFPQEAMLKAFIDQALGRTSVRGGR